MRGLVIVVSGPSGVGKGTILAAAEERLSGLRRSISVTTRSARPGEIDGEHYFFRTLEEFERLKVADDFLEWAKYLDSFYGTPRSWVLEQLENGRDVTLEIDVQGGRQVKAKFPEAVLIFVEPPSENALRERLEKRSTENEDVIQRRLAAYRHERESLPIYDYIIRNDNLDDAVDLFCCILRAEKARVARRASDG
jgi:guanylate kinase